MGSAQQIEQDLRETFDAFPLQSLRHLRDNRHRLVRGVYTSEEGGGCILTLLSEPLPPEQRIDSRPALWRYFGFRPENWQHVVDMRQEDFAARWIIRLWDGRNRQGLHERYGSTEPLSEQTLMRVLDEVIAERTAIQQEAAEVRSRISQRRIPQPIAAC